jgi:hypothetical protein
VIWPAIHSAVGLVVTLILIRSLRSIRTSRQQFEANGGDHERIHGGSVRSLVSQKGPPSLTWRSTSFHHVLGDRCLSDAKPKLEQFAVDAWRTRKLVLRAHLSDQRAQFHLDSRAPSPRVRFPTPITTKAGPMPAHQRFRSDNRNDRQDRWKPWIHLDEEPAIVNCEPSPAFSLRRKTIT